MSGERWYAATERPHERARAAELRRRRAAEVRDALGVLAVLAGMLALAWAFAAATPPQTCAENDLAPAVRAGGE